MRFSETINFVVVQATRFFMPVGMALEWVLVFLMCVLVVAVPSPFSRSLLALQRGFRRIAEHKRLSVLICGILPVAIRLCLLPAIPIPEPSIHDEFSHLLLADTLAHGRLTNPTHPMWMHFESIHIIQRPTYNSMYPPAQGAFLALGEVAFHEPWAGVEVSIAFMFAAICWMMQGWLPPAWALFGTLIAILKIGIVGFWVNSYMGGSPAAIGGALLIGALPRLRSPGARRLPAFLFGLGAVILMNSRPFEGGILGLAAVAYLSRDFVRKFRIDRRLMMRTIVYPAGAIVAVGLVFTGYYCWRVTGKPTRMPYQVNRRTYGWPENLAFLKPKKISLRDPVLEDMYTQEVRHHEIYKNPETIIDNLMTRVFDNWAYLVGPVLTIPFLLPFLFVDRRTRPLLACVLLMAFVNLFQMLLYPYHLAQIIPVIFAIIAEGVRRIYVSVGRRAPARGGWLAVLLCFSLVLVGAVKQEAEELNIPVSSYWERGYELQRDARASIAAWLTAQPGKHLVIVRYSQGHSVNQEWVYNGADIDGSKIVWARDMGPSGNTELLRYFHDRHAWLVEADVSPQRVVPYPAMSDSRASVSACGLCRPTSKR